MATDFQPQRLTIRPHNSKRRSWQLILASAVICGLTQLCLPGQATAQVLNQQVNQLLANRCAGLNPTFIVGIPQGFDSQLQTLCTQGSGGSVPAASSSGGGAASVQGSATSILNRVLLQQLNELDEEESQKPLRSSSLRLNPFNSLLLGSAQNLAISSPFYASTMADAGSPTTFTAGSQNRWHGLGFFGTGLVEALNRDITTFQDGYKSNIYGFTIGTDYRFNKRLVTGLAFSYSNTNGDFRSGGTFNTNSYGGLLFASFLPTDKIFIQATGGYARNNYLVARLANAVIRQGTNIIAETPPGLASSNSNGDIFTLGFLTGYDHPIGRFTIGPRFGVNYSHTHIHSYAETGNTGVELKYGDQWINSLQSVLGIQGSAAFSTSLGVLVPQFNADYIHEFSNSQRLINVQFAQDLRSDPTKFTFQNEVPVRNYFNVGTGLVMVLPNGWQPFIAFRAMIGNEHFNNYVGTFGLRIAL